MKKMKIKKYLPLLCLLFMETVNSQALVEISGSPFDTQDAPLPQVIKNPLEKVILVDPVNHVWGAYNAIGKLLRWGIATAGEERCRDSNHSCKTKIGTFRIYMLGDANCISHKFPIEDGGGAAMPYCMYFNGNEALHGTTEVAYGNVSHGCVRMHIDDAKWLRYQFVEAPSEKNYYQGTKVIILPY